MRVKWDGAGDSFRAKYDGHPGPAIKLFAYRRANGGGVWEWCVTRWSFGARSDVMLQRGTASSRDAAKRAAASAARAWGCAP